MCGLSAVVQQLPGVTASILRSANDSIRHRGPDDEGVWINDARTCGLGHVRLSIIDPAGGHQPLSSPDKSIHAIVNGEFYGFDSIREDFIKAGYPFSSKSDSEILIPLYMKYGEECLEHLRGEFAFVLWDENKQQLFIARDRFGIKPLFHARQGDRFYVGSEIKALLAMGMPAQWDMNTVFEDETRHRNCTDTLFRNVKCVPPGHFMLIQGDGSKLVKYWDFNYPEKQHLHPDRPEKEYVDEFWALLSEAVRLRLRADVPVGVYLSGGIDSSVVLSLMREHTCSALDAFTLSFDHASYDESAIAREMAAFAGVRHSVIDIDAGVLAPNFEDTVWHNECPFANSNSIAKYILSRHVRDAGVKVVLTGEGSDELLGGYSHYLSDMRLNNSRAAGPVIAKQVRRLKQFLGGLQSGKPALADPYAEFSAVRDKLGFVPAQLAWTGNALSAYAQVRGSEFGSQPARFEALMRSLDESQVAGRDPLNQSLYLSSKSTLPNMILTVLGDRVEMAHSIEARLPFLDHKVVEFLTRLPVDLKIKVKLRGGIEKYLLKEAARGQVTETLYRRTKHAFEAPPIVSASADPMAEFIGDTLHGSDMRSLKIYDQARLIKLHEDSKNHHRGYLSGVFMRIAGMAIMQRRFGLSNG